MKFGKRLQRHVEESLPEWREKYICYKQMKRRLNLICAILHGPPNIFLDRWQRLTQEETAFVLQLYAELRKFNAFFLEKEEEFVIRLQELKEQIEKVITRGGLPFESDLSEEIINIQRESVNLHGEMVLLENYSSLNFTGMSKILKKHDRRTGAILRKPFMESVLHEPFFMTDLLSRLVQESEAILLSFFPLNHTIDTHPRHPHDPFMRGDLDIICKSTMVALRTFTDLRRGSSTYNTFSLPPLAPLDVYNNMRWYGNTPATLTI